MEGLAMGGSIGGPYGAGGGLVLGFIAGLFTADAHYGKLNSQIQIEQQKDRQLEVAIEQELERQRALEAQVANAAAPPTGSSGSQADLKSMPQGDTAGSQTPPTAARPAEQSQTGTQVALHKNVPTAVPASPFKNVEVRDINGDGVPDLWIYYDPARPGEIVRQEEASKADGRVDTWTHFKDGIVVRREVDSKGLGRPDIAYYYENDRIAREERDESGTGQINYRAFYEQGRLARVEKAANGRGKTDLWIYYDTTKDGEIILREERDLNGDGAIDLWSHYEQGQLVRRDVSAIGLELFAKQDQVPSSAVDTQKIAASD
ncbi:MAG: toxin-antitoxin system YwqK family antitoxin [Gammaproteobacteria bacterium]